jgi:hypothetical protein
VYLARVNFVEQLAHHKRMEHLPGMANGPGLELPSFIFSSFFSFLFTNMDFVTKHIALCSARTRPYRNLHNRYHTIV